MARPMRRYVWPALLASVAVGCADGATGAPQDASETGAADDSDTGGSTHADSTTSDDTSTSGTATDEDMSTSTSTADASSSGDSGSSTVGESSSSSSGDTGSAACDLPDGAELNMSLVVAAQDVVYPLAAIGDLDGGLFVAERAGSIRYVPAGQTNALPGAVLETAATVVIEGGLLSIALHPDYPAMPLLYVALTLDEPGLPGEFSPTTLTILEYTLDGQTPPAAAPIEARTILRIYEPMGFHNGGDIEFDSDGMLLISTGEGANVDLYGVDDDDGVLLGKILRIGVEPDGQPDDPASCAGCPTLGPFDYTIPEDNPWVDVPGAAPEVFAMGFRNPYRIAVDRITGQVFAGDVGDSQREEVDLVLPGQHHGWTHLEGSCAGAACGPFTPGAIVDGYVNPIAQYDNPGCAAVILGAVLRDCSTSALDGAVIYTDHCDPHLRAARPVDDTWETIDIDVGAVASYAFVGSGSTWDGGVLLTGYDPVMGSSQGRVWRLAASGD